MFFQAKSPSHDPGASRVRCRDNFIERMAKNVIPTAGALGSLFLGTLAGKASAEQNKPGPRSISRDSSTITERVDQIASESLCLNYFSARDTVISGRPAIVVEGAIPAKYSGSYSAKESDLEPKAVAEVTRLANDLSARGATITQVELKGRASFEGDPVSNQKLSVRRAGVFAGIFTRKVKVDSKQISTTGHVVSLKEMDPGKKIDALTKPSPTKSLIQRAKTLIASINAGSANKNIAEVVQPLIDNSRSVQVRFIAERTDYVQSQSNSSTITSLSSLTPPKAPFHIFGGQLSSAAVDAVATKTDFETDPATVNVSKVRPGLFVPESSLAASTSAAQSHQTDKSGFIWGLGLGIMLAAGIAAIGRAARSKFRDRAGQESLSGLDIPAMVHGPIGTDQVPQPTGQRLQNMNTFAKWESEASGRAPFELMLRVHQLATITPDQPRSVAQIRDQIAVEYTQHMAKALVGSTKKAAHYGELSSWVQQARISADLSVKKYFELNTIASSVDPTGDGANPQIGSADPERAQPSTLREAIAELQQSVVSVANGTNALPNAALLEKGGSGLSLVRINPIELAQPQTNLVQAVAPTVTPKVALPSANPPSMPPITNYAPPNIPIDRKVLEHIYLNAVPATRTYDHRQELEKQRKSEIESAELEFIRIHKDGSPYFELEQEVYQKYRPNRDAMVRLNDPVLGSSVSWREAAENELTARIVWQRVAANIDDQVDLILGDDIAVQPRINLSSKEIVSARAAAIQTQILAAERRRKERMFA